MKIFYASSGPPIINSLIEAGSKNIMLTYFNFYSRKDKRNYWEILSGFPRKVKISERWKERLKHFDEVMIDSGAYTFQAKSGVYGKIQSSSQVKPKEVDEFVEHYGKWLRENKGYYNYFVEMDIDKVVGLKKVEEYRKFIEQCAGEKCMPIWHENRGLDYWLRMINEYKYVGIGGLAVGEIKNYERKISYMLKLAHEKGCKVHGIGFTKFKFLKFLPYDTVDSSTWLGGGKTGQYHLYLDGGMRSLPLRDYGFKTKKVNYLVFNTMNAKSWKGFSDSLQSYWEKQKREESVKNS